ncbi:MAG: hypothetical protein HYX53_16780 [Chloroflexi bacterium]|nr:hypothetical protein [Chloroflexota bacterium]
MTAARRLPRRRFLAGLGVAAAGIAGASACGGRERVASQRPSGTGTAATASPQAAQSPTPSPPRGGVARISPAAALSFDTFDSARTGEVSTVEVLGRTHSRLLQWSDFATATIAGDLAAKWEQPDATHWVFSVDPLARWHDRAPVNGRAVTAGDVVAHIQRVLSLARSTRLPGAQRAQDWARIRAVSTSEPGIVTLETDGPEPLLPVTLAGRFALVQAPEAVEAFAGTWAKLRPEEVIGSGPFTFEGADPSGAYSFKANTRSHSPPLLDGVSLFATAASLTGFRARMFDEVLTRDRRDAAALRQDPGGQAVELARFEDSPVLSTLAVGGPPWNNPELLRALSGALNRSWLATSLFGGRAAPAGAIGPAFPAFELAGAELAQFPGFGADADADARAAKARWDAAGGPALGAVTIDFPSIFDPLYSASSVVTGRLNAVLGGQFRAAVETYTTISAKAVSGSYGNGKAAFWFGWGPPLAEPDPSRALVESYGGGSDALGATASRLAAEFAPDRRKALMRELAGAAMAAGGAGTIPWVLQRGELFRWLYYRAAAPAPFWPQHLDRTSYLDPGAGGFDKRP